MVVILRIADEVIAGRQVFNLDTGAGGVDSFALRTVTLMLGFAGSVGAGGASSSKIALTSTSLSGMVNLSSLIVTLPRMTCHSLKW